MKALTLWDPDDMNGEERLKGPPFRRSTKTRGVQITERDLAAIAWIADQYAVRTDVLCWKLGSAGPLSESRTRTVVARWRRAGLAVQRRVFAGSPQVVWPTRQGQRLVRPDWRWREPSVAMLGHHHVVSAVRLALELNGEATSWTPERSLLKGRIGPSVHVPDGVYLDRSGKETAVEVELTQKSSDRLRGIVRELSLDYRSVVYVVGEGAIGTAVMTAVNSLGEEERVRVAEIGDLWPPRRN